MSLVRKWSAMRAPRWRETLAGAVFVLVLAGSFQPFYVRVFLLDRDALAARIDSLRFGRMPEIRPFLHSVERRTEMGESVALVTPFSWHQGYEYAFYRASYVLAGRTVLPVITPTGRSISQNVKNADVVAAWQVDLDPGQFEVLWRGDGGTLARPR
jgi:hypothetical protein